MGHQETFAFDLKNAFPFYYLQTPKYVAGLKCHLKQVDDPYYKLTHIKEEVIHQKPDIWMYHDVLSPTESQDVISTARPFVSVEC